jgi:hypothetical protein
MAESWDVPPFYTVGHDESGRRSVESVQIIVTPLPGRGIDEFGASVVVSEWGPLWQRIVRANADADAVVKVRDEQYKKARRVPLLGGILAGITDGNSMETYYRVEMEAWEAARALLLLVERYAQVEHRSRATAFLDMPYSTFGTRRSEYRRRSA